MQRAMKSPGDKIRPPHTWKPKPAGKTPSTCQAGSLQEQRPCPGRATHPHARTVQGTVILDEPVVIAPICREIKPAVSVMGAAGTMPGRPRNETDPEMRQMSLRSKLYPRALELAASMGDPTNPHTTSAGDWRGPRLTRKQSACKPQCVTMTTSSLAGTQKPTSPR